MARFILNPDIAINRWKSLGDYGEVWYNLKTNPEVGKVLEERTDASFVVTGMGNLSRLEDPSRAVMLVQGESRDQMSKATEQGIRGFIVDNEPDLSRVLEVSSDEEIFLRIKVKEHTLYTGKYYVYGIDWRRAVELIDGLDREVGIHFHRKTQNVGEWSLIDDLRPVLEAVDVPSVNIGGGLPVQYYSSRPDTEPILNKIAEFRDFLDERDTRLIMEPGRYIAAPSVELETRVVNAYSDKLVLDASIYNSSMDTFLFNVRLPVKGEVEEGHKYVLKGYSPDSLDIFRYKVFFKDEKARDDLIVFENAGAYNFHTDFADLPQIPTVIL